MTLHFVMSQKNLSLIDITTYTNANAEWAEIEQKKSGRCSFFFSFSSIHLLLLCILVIIVLYFVRHTHTGSQFLWLSPFTHYIVRFPIHLSSNKMLHLFFFLLWLQKTFRRLFFCKILCRCSVDDHFWKASITEQQ